MWSYFLWYFYHFTFYCIFISTGVSTASRPDVDEEIDFLSSVINKQQISEVKPGLNYLFLKSVWLWLERWWSVYIGNDS